MKAKNYNKIEQQLRLALKRLKSKATRLNKVMNSVTDEMAGRQSDEDSFSLDDAILATRFMDLHREYKEVAESIEYTVTRMWEMGLEVSPTWRVPYWLYFEFCFLRDQRERYTGVRDDVRLAKVLDSLGRVANDSEKAEPKNGGSCSGG